MDTVRIYPDTQLIRLSFWCGFYNHVKLGKQHPLDKAAIQSYIFINPRGRSYQ